MTIAIYIAFVITFTLLALAVTSGFRLIKFLSQFSGFKWRNVWLDIWDQILFACGRAPLEVSHHDNKCVIYCGVWATMLACLMTLMLQILDMITGHWLEAGVHRKLQWLFAASMEAMGVILLHVGLLALIQAGREPDADGKP